MKFNQIKIYKTSQHPDHKDQLVIYGPDKNEKGHQFLLIGQNRCLLFGSRFQVGVCVNIETYDDGTTIKRMERAIDTIEELD